MIFYLKYLLQIIFMTSLKSSILILIIMAFRKSFRQDFSARWSYIIWLLVVIRLVLPLSPIKSSLTLYKLSFFRRFSVSYKDLLLGLLGTDKNQINFIEQTYSCQQIISDTLSFDLIKAFAVIWIVGVQLLLALFIFTSLKLIIHIKSLEQCKETSINNQVDHLRQQLHIRRKVTVYFTSSATSPITYGFIHPLIVLSTPLTSHFTENELCHVLLHELIHIKRFDIIFNHIGLLFCILHWFNPIIWTAYFISKTDCEFACDETVLKYLSQSNYTKYAKTLVLMLKLLSDEGRPKSPIVQTLIHTYSEVHYRINNITSYRKRHLVVIIISNILLLFIALIGFNDDSGVRTGSANSNDDFSNYLGLAYPDVNAYFKGLSHQLYLVNPNKNPYFIYSYDLQGTTVQLWFDATDGSTGNKVMEVTTNRYMGIEQGMSSIKAKQLATDIFGPQTKVFQRNGLNYYCYQTATEDITILCDLKGDKVYSISLY